MLHVSSQFLHTIGTLYADMLGPLHKAYYKAFLINIIYILR